VEHDPERIWQSVQTAFAKARTQSGGAIIAAIGITNQRETTVLWERATGRPVAPAIVWQDGAPPDVLIDAAEDWNRRAPADRPRARPYFSASKIPSAGAYPRDLRRRAEAGEIAFGQSTASSSGGAPAPGSSNDVSNASRTRFSTLNGCSGA